MTQIGTFLLEKKSLSNPALDEVELRDGVNDFKNIFFKFGKEVALWGFDAEVGYNVWRGLSLFAGGFYFHRDNVETLGGPFFRLYYAYQIRSTSFL